jgi:chitodextrinase
MPAIRLGRVISARGLLALIATLAGSCAQASVSYVQSAYTTIFGDAGGPTVSATYASAQSAGNVNLVVVGWLDSTATVASVTDSSGNVYSLAVGPTRIDGTGAQAIYYAKNIASAAANANSVTVTFNHSVPYPDVRIAEYNGVSATSPVDAAAGSTGYGTAMDSGPLVTTAANDRIVLGNYLQTTTTAEGSGYQERFLDDFGQVIADAPTSSPSTYHATATQNEGWWILQAVALQPASTGSGDTQAPTTPAGLTATTQPGPGATLSWTASTDDVGVTGYRIERCQGSGCATFAQIATSGTTSFTDTGLAGSTSYTYRVRASDAAGNLSGYSGSATSTTGTAALYVQSSSTTDYGPVSHIEATFPNPQNAGDLNVVVIAWDDTTSNVQSVTDSSGNTYVLAVGPTRTSGNGSQAIYYAKNIVSSAAGTNIVSVSLDSDVAYPDLRIAEYSGLDTVNPLDATAGAAGDGTMADSGPLTTTNAHDLLLASDYVYSGSVYAGSGFTARFFTSFGSLVEDANVNATGTYHGVAPQSDSGWWVMQVVAFREASAGGGGGGDTSPPTVPTALSASVSSSSQIDLTWSASSDNVGVTGYLLERCQGSGCTNFVQIATPTGASYSDSGLSASTSYSYRVRARDAAGNQSDYSSVANATTSSGGGGGGGGGDTQPPTTPAGLEAMAISGSQIALSWSASTDNVGVTGYLLERCHGSACTTFAQIAAPTSTSYTDSGLAMSTTYIYRVRATDAAGNLSGYSGSTSATTDATGSICD